MKQKDERATLTKGQTTKTETSPALINDKAVNSGSWFKKYVSGQFHNRELLLVIFVSFAVYFNALFNGFAFDDILQIVKNPWIKDIRYIPNMFFENVWGFVGQNSNYYRPLMHVSYMLSYFIFGLKPWGFHLVNVTLHVLNSLLVYLIIRQLLGVYPGIPRERYGSPAFWAAMLFAVHPIHTEVVAPIMGIADLSFTFFYLLALYAYMQSEAGMRKSYIIALFSFFLALLCKEPAITLPAIFFAYDYAVRKERLSLPVILKGYSPFLVLAVLYILMRTLALGSFTTIRRHTDLTDFGYLINVLPLFKQYLEKLLLPVNLNFLHSFKPIHSLYEKEALFALVWAAIFAGGAWLAFRKNRIALLALLLITLPLLPALYIPALNQELENAFAERYLYLPSCGFVLLLALSFSFIGRSRLNNILVSAVYAVVAGIAVLYAIGTIDRNVVWKDNFTLFADAVRKSPDSAYPHIYLGQALYTDKGDLDGAIAEYQLGLKLKPDNPDAHNKLGIVYLRKGWIDQAIVQHEWALRLAPDFGPAHNNLGLAYFHKGWNEEAITQYLLALKQNPRFIEAHNNLGLAYYRQGRVREALERYQYALRLDPSFANAHNNIGVAYGEAGLVEQALWHFAEAVRLNPSDINSQQNLQRARETKLLMEKRNSRPQDR